MAGLLTSSSTLMCPHGGSVSATTTNTKVKAGGSFLVRKSDTFMIAGCPFAIGPTPHPCVQVQWEQAALKNQAAGDFTLTENSVGLCIAADQAPQGPVQIASTQEKATGL